MEESTQQKLKKWLKRQKKKLPKQSRKKEKELAWKQA